VTERAPWVIVLAPGAGAGSDSPWMRGWRERLSGITRKNVYVETLDYPYRRAGRKAPDKLPVLIEAHRQALAEARSHVPAGARVALVGKSMGGRVGCHVALAEPIDALVCLGYPLRGAAGTLRDEVLLGLRVPVLFVQGTRDPLCPLDLLRALLPRMTARNALFVVEGGNHSLEVPRRGAAAGAQERSDQAVLQAIQTFLDGV
jgi:predicted alpha/beta-hydrolase family hydrolase